MVKENSCFRDRWVVAAFVFVLLGSLIAAAKVVYESQRPARPWTDEARRENGIPLEEPRTMEP